MKNRKINGLYLSFVFLLLNLESYSQVIQCDSCEYYSCLFKDTCNLCSGLSYESYLYLEKHCIKYGMPEDSIVSLLGLNNFSKNQLHRRTREMELQKLNCIDEDYDYYLPYFIGVSCFNPCELSYFPSTQTWLFFKERRLIKIVYKSYG